MINPLIKGLKVAPFVECLNCHLLSPLGTESCSGCSAEMNPTEYTKIHVVVLNTGAKDQRFTPFVECPNCRKLLKVGIGRCPECYEEVTEEYAVGSALAVVINTIAIDLANSIRGMDSFAPIAVIVSVFSYLISLYFGGRPFFFYLVLIYPAIPLSAILLWFFRFGRFNGDDEYLTAKRRLKRSLWIWLGILSAQIIALGVLRS